MPGQVKGTNTIFFIQKNQVPVNRWNDITYRRIVASYRPKKNDPNRIRLTVRVNRINYPGNCGTPTFNLLTVKLHLNSTTSTKEVHYTTINIKDFYLNTHMAR